MKKHVKIALQARKLSGCDDWFCEICAEPSLVRHLDCHHIEPKGMGGRAGADTAENLILCCRSCHSAAHRSEYKKETLAYHVKQVLEKIK